MNLIKICLIVAIFEKLRISCFHHPESFADPQWRQRAL